MQFEVRAAGNNAVTTVRVEALNEADARMQVTRQSLRPLSVRIARRGVAGAVRARPSRFSLLLFSQELLALLEGGLGIVESMDVLLEKETRPAAQRLYGAIARGLAEGKSFSACTAHMPDVFPPLYTGMLRSAEKTSTLTSALSRYIEYETRIEGVRTRVVSASIYPAILMLVGIGVIVFLAAYVVPRFASVYEGTGRTLPFMSAWLLTWGVFVTSHGREMMIVLAVLACLMVALVRNARRRGGITWLLGLVPFFEERVRTYALSRLYLTLGMLLEGGLPVTEALTLARATLGPGQQDALDRAMRDVMNGESLPDAFERAGLTTPVAVRFMRVGEQSGRLAEMLNRSARYYDGEISRWIERFTRTFEPLLMVGIGLIVGLIVVLLYMPIFDLAGSLQ
jgi:general secretion pathway protein F